MKFREKNKVISENFIWMSEERNSKEFIIVNQMSITLLPTAMVTSADFFLKVFSHKRIAFYI